MSMKQLTSKQVMQHAYNPMTTKSIGYGSIDKGLQVLAYRNSRSKYYMLNSTLTYEDRARLVQSEVEAKFGKPL